MKSEQLLSLIAAGIVALVTILFGCYQVAPQFTSYLLLLTFAAFCFILTEQWKTHDAAEFENRFWTLLAFCFSTACLFTKDSPLCFPAERRGIAWSIVCLCTYCCHIGDRNVRRYFLTRASNIRRQRSADFNAENRAQAKLKVVQLKKQIQAIDLRWVSSTILNIFFLPYVLSAENQILEILSDANRDELNLIIGDENFELALILYKVKDHWVTKRFNRTKLLQLLAKDRIFDLNVRSRAGLLEAIQRLKVSAHPNLQDYVRNIIVSTKGDDLSELKCITDSKGDIHSMHHLLFIDIKDNDIKKAVLEHIATQARIQASFRTTGGPRARRRAIYAWRKILSDVDDTLVCSGGSFPKGMDTGYPKQSLYPGVIAFYRELDLGTTGPDSIDHLRMGNLAFISARPHVYKDVSESQTYNKFRQLQEKRGLHTSPTLLAGSLDTGSKFLVLKDSEALARKKYENFQEYLSLYPEFSCVFVGDNGQGDVRAAELVLDDPLFQHYLTRTYIHVVQNLEDMHVRASNFKCHDNPRGVCYFSTYVDAAIDAFDQGLVRATGLHRLMTEAVRDFLLIPDDAWKLINTEDVKSNRFLLKQRTAKLLAASSATASAASISNGDGAILSAGSERRPRGDSFNLSSAIASFTSPRAASSSTSTTVQSGSGSAHTSIASTATVSAEGATTMGLLGGVFSPPATPQRRERNSSTGSVEDTTLPPATPSSATTTKSVLASKSSSSAGASSSIANQTTSTKATLHTSSFFGSSGSTLKMKPASSATATATAARAQLQKQQREREEQQRSSLAKATLALNLSDGWEIRRNRLAIFCGPVKASKRVTGLMKRELRTRELNIALEYGNSLLWRHHQMLSRQLRPLDKTMQLEREKELQVLAEPVHLLEYPQAYALQTKVRTPFGLGVIQSFRSVDGIYEVVIDKNACLLQRPTPIAAAMNQNVTTSNNSNSASSGVSSSSTQEKKTGVVEKDGSTDKDQDATENHHKDREGGKEAASAEEDDERQVLRQRLSSSCESTTSNTEGGGGTTEASAQGSGENAATHASSSTNATTLPLLLASSTFCIKVYVAGMNLHEVKA